MGSSAAIRAGQAFIEFTLKDNAVTKVLQKWEGRFKSFGSTMSTYGAGLAGIGGAVLGTLGAAATLFAGVGGELADMSGRTSVSTDHLQELSYAAKQTGADMATIEKAMLFMRKEGKDPGRFGEVAAKIAAIEDPTKRTQAAMEAFGKKTGPALLPMIGDLAELTDHFRELGIAMSEEDVTAADELGDATDDLTMQLQAAVVQIGAAIAGPLTDLLHATQPILKAIIDWIRNNKALIQTVALVSTALVVAGGVLIGVGVGFQALAFVAGGVVAAMGFVATVLGAIISPAGAVIAIVAGVVTWFLTMTETGRGMVASLVGWFGELSSIATSSFGAIAAALSAGDIGAAAEVLWATLKLLWLQGTAELREAWASLTGGVVKLWHTAWAGVLQMVNSGSGGLERGWSHTLQFLGNAWDVFVAGIKMGWESTIAFFQTTWLRIKGLFGADVEAEIARINSAVSKANDATLAGAGNSILSRDAAAEADRKLSSSNQNAVLDKIGEELAAKLGATDNSTKDAIEAQKEQLERARSAWGEATAAANAIGEAAAARKAADAELGNGAAAGMADELGKTMSLGTFSADAVASLSGGGAAEETAENTRRMAKSLDRIERKESDDWAAD